MLGVDDRPGEPLRVHVETIVEIEGCSGCETRSWVKDRRPVALVDLAAFCHPAVLVWHKRRWRCPDLDCATGTWTETDPRIAPDRARVTDRASQWVTGQVGRDGRTVAEVARQLGCDWHTVMDALVAYGTPLIEDPDRIGAVTALGLDETLFARTGEWRTREWSTAIVDVGRPSQLLESIEGRTARAASAWIDARPKRWRDGIDWVTLVLSGPYRKAFNDSLPDATQIADPFHVVKLANTKLDETRRRVQQDTLGHRGHKADPLYRSRRLLTKAHERLDVRGEAKLLEFLDAGAPKGDVRLASACEGDPPRLLRPRRPRPGRDLLDELVDDLLDPDHPPEVRGLGRTLRRWRGQVLAWDLTGWKHPRRRATPENPGLAGSTRRSWDLGSGWGPLSR